MKKKRNKSPRPAPNGTPHYNQYLSPYWPGKVYIHDQSPNGTLISVLIKAKPHATPRLIVARHALDIAIAITGVALAAWCAAYIYIVRAGA